MNTETRKLQDEIRSIKADMRSLHELCKKEKRSLTQDEDKQWDRMYTDMRSKEKQLEREIVLQEEDRSNAKSIIDEATPPGQGSEKRTKTKQAEEARSAIRSYMTQGKEYLSKEERKILFGPAGILRDGESRSQSSVTANLGAEMVREEYFNEFEKHMIAASGIMEAARIIRTKTGAALPWPTVNDTSNKGRRIGESVASTKTNVPTDKVTLYAYKYSSDHVLVPSELEQDDSYGFVSEIPAIQAERVARGFNEEATTADGSSKPQGITIGASNSTLTVAVNTITRDDLLELKHKINRAYRGKKVAKWMFNDDTLMRIAKLATGSADDRPLWLPSMRDDVPDTIEGHAYVINDDMPDLSTSGNRAILFGDFSKFLVRIVRDFNVKRADEKHIDTDEIGFYGFARMDSRIINADAIKYLAVT